MAAECTRCLGKFSVCMAFSCILIGAHIDQDSHYGIYCAAILWTTSMAVDGEEDVADLHAVRVFDSDSILRLGVCCFKISWAVSH